MWAAREGKVEAVQALADAGVDVDAVNNEGWTALMAAASNNRPEAVKALLAAGADPGIKAKAGWSALVGASGKGDIESVKALIEAGADLDMGDGNKGTPLMHAASRDSLKQSRFYLKPVLTKVSQIS